MGLAQDIKKALDKKISAEMLRESTKQAIGILAENIVNDAKTNLRTNFAIDRGTLLNSIYAEPIGDDLQVNIVAGAPHAAFIEFGTRSFAEKYVPKLPKAWQELASQFKGEGKGDFVDFAFAILDWMDRKGIQAGKKNPKTGRRLGNAEQKEKEDLALATAIVYKILKKGIKAKPYLYPAVTKNVISFEKELSKILK